jgi:hypothetical protein
MPEDQPTTTTQAPNPKLGDPHPDNPKLFALWTVRGKTCWGSKSKLESTRRAKAAANKSYSAANAKDFPLKCAWPANLASVFPKQRYGDDSTDWEAAEELYRKRDRLNAAHPTEGKPIFSVKRKVSAKEGGMLSLENSEIRVLSRFRKTHTKFIDNPTPLTGGGSLESILSSHIDSVRASTELFKTLQQNHVVSSKLAELGKLLAA